MSTILDRYCAGANFAWFCFELPRMFYGISLPLAWSMTIALRSWYFWDLIMLNFTFVIWPFCAFWGPPSTAVFAP
jgi:hypothetical protein